VERLVIANDVNARKGRKDGGLPHLQCGNGWPYFLQAASRQKSNYSDTRQQCKNLLFFGVGSCIIQVRQPPVVASFYKNLPPPPLNPAFFGSKDSLDSRIFVHHHEINCPFVPLPDIRTLSSGRCCFAFPLIFKRTLHVRKKPIIADVGNDLRARFPGFQWERKL